MYVYDKIHIHFNYVDILNGCQFLLNVTQLHLDKIDIKETR